MLSESFETALTRLDEVVRRLESGDLTLDDSLKYYQEGMRLVRFCARKLDEAEKRIEQLTEDEDGSLVLQPFPLDIAEEA